MKKIGIIGCGWLGLRIATQLSDHFEIYATTTTKEKMDLLTEKGFHPTLINFQDATSGTTSSQWDVIADLDCIIVTVSFSEKYHASPALYHRSQQLQAFIGEYKRQLFFMSSTGVYPPAEQVLIEEDVSITTVFGENMIHEAYPQVNILRLAGLMGDNRLLKHYKVTDLALPVNHVHYIDVGSVIEKMIQKQSTASLYNVVAPLHPSKKEVLDAQNNIPSEAIPQPKGRIIASDKIMAALGFEFQRPDPRFFHL